MLAHHWLSVLLQLFVLPKDRQVHEAIDTASLGDGRRRGWEAQALQELEEELRSMEQKRSGDREIRRFPVTIPVSLKLCEIGSSF